MPETVHPTTSAVLGDRYELRRLLGVGGSGTVHLAYDRVLGREVAVKMLRPGEDHIARLRLKAEARIAGSLAHPGVARLLDYGEQHDGDVASPYLVMEYVEGRTLREVLRTGDRLTTARVLHLVADVADALAAVHAAGIVHRDLKPGNIVLNPKGRAILLDFGIARHDSHDPLTVTGTIVGTVDYISPEQASGTSATPRSDLYALGMVAYECLTGLRPLSRDTQVSTLMAHANIPVPPLPPSVPEEARTLIMSMVALDPHDRPQDAEEVARRARTLLRHPSTRRMVAPPLLVEEPAGSSSSSGLAGAGRLRDRLGGRPHLIAAGCAVLLLLAGMLFLLERTEAPVGPAAAGVASAADAHAGDDRTAATPSAVATPVATAVRTPSHRAAARHHRAPVAKPKAGHGHPGHHRHGGPHGHKH